MPQPQDAVVPIEQNVTGVEGLSIMNLIDKFQDSATVVHKVTSWFNDTCQINMSIDFHVSVIGSLQRVMLQCQETMNGHGLTPGVKSTEEVLEHVLEITMSTFPPSFDLVLEKFEETIHF